MKALVALVAFATTAHASPGGIERGIKLYDKRDFISASIELHDVVTSGNPADAMRAQFFLGKTLYQLGLHAPAVAYFDRIAQDPTHPYHGQIVKWLLAIQGPAIGPVLKALGPDQLEPELVDRFRFASGAYVAVTEASPLWSRAQLALARAAFARGDVDPAIARASAAARDAAIAGDVARAIADGAGPRGRDALSRISDPLAAYYSSRFAVEASGRLAAINDPIVLATACISGAADNIVALLDASVAETRALLGRLLVHDDNAETFVQVAHMRGIGAAEVAVRFALATPDLAELAQWHDELRRELELVQRSDRAWQTTAVAAEALQELSVQIAVLEADIGKLYRDRLLAMQAQLAHAFTGTRAAVPVGPNTRDGFVVAKSLCSAVLGGHSAPAIVAGGSPPRVHGCAGCATGDPAWLIALAMLPWLRRARRPGPTARAACGAARRRAAPLARPRAPDRAPAARTARR